MKPALVLANLGIAIQAFSGDERVHCMLIATGTRNALINEARPA